MKKQLLTLGLAILTASLFAAAPWSGKWGGDTSRNKVTIKHVTEASWLPTRDGIADEAIWKNLPAIPIERNWKNRPYYPTLYSCTFKAFWTDDAIWILIQNKDNSFWSSWKAGLSDYLCDKVELYFGVNGIGTNDGAGGAQNGKKTGLYQVTQNYQRHAFMGIDTLGNQPNTHEASTYIYSANGDTVYETIEWMVSLSTLKNSLTTDSAALDPASVKKILFDVCVSDLDSAADQAQRYRQGWSGLGWPDEGWANMDSAGVLTFSTEDVVATREITTTNEAIVVPTVVTDYVTILGDNTNVQVYNTLGQLVLTSKGTNSVSLGKLNTGVYIIKVANTATRVFKK
jgi:hypothetical protein